MEEQTSKTPVEKPPPKTNWMVLILIVVIAGGLIAYFWIGQKSCPGNEGSNVSVAVPTATPTITPTVTVTGDAEAQAQQVLEDFFDYASSGEYAKAALLLEPMEEGGEVATSWDDMPGLGVEDPPTDHGEILKLYCESFETCLAVKVLQATKIDDNTYQFEVNFLNADGTTYEMGPCCGATGPPNSTFVYYVKYIDGDWKVITAPAYHP
ncbi:hypothetical protein ACFL0Z_03370 [Patescibacteria group bacterium]